MIVALLVLLAGLAAATWAFVRFAPVHADRRSLWRFNLLSLIAALFLAAAWIARTYRVMSATVDAAWWPVVALLGGLVIALVMLALAAAVRNLVVFRRR